MRAIIFLSVSICLALVAFFYKPPKAVYNEILQAMADQPEWSLHAEGMVEESLLKLDMAVNADGKSFLRISYPALKIINNQWIDITGDSVSVMTDTEYSRSITKRRLPIKQNGTWYDRYEFIAPAKAMDLFPTLNSIAGELWFPFKIVWPWQSPRKLPAIGVADISLRQQPARAYTARYSLALAFTYSSTSDQNKFASARLLSDVLAQLEKMKNVQNENPKALVPLTAVVSSELGFFQDFDKDGLSDALEIFYGVDPSNPDTDNDTFLDGEEVDRGYSPRVSYGNDNVILEGSRNAIP